MRKYGIGRIFELAKAIEDIWRNPDRVHAYQRVQDEYRALLAKP